MLKKDPAGLCCVPLGKESAPEPGEVSGALVQIGFSFCLFPLTSGAKKIEGAAWNSGSD